MTTSRAAGWRTKATKLSYIGFGLILLFALVGILWTRKLQASHQTVKVNFYVKAAEHASTAALRFAKAQFAQDPNYTGTTDTVLTDNPDYTATISIEVLSTDATGTRKDIRAIGSVFQKHETNKTLVAIDTQLTSIATLSAKPSPAQFKPAIWLDASQAANFRANPSNPTTFSQWVDSTKKDLIFTAENNESLTHQQSSMNGEDSVLISANALTAQTDMPITSQEYTVLSVVKMLPGSKPTSTVFTGYNSNFIGLTDPTVSIWPLSFTPANQRLTNQIPFTESSISADCQTVKTSCLSIPTLVTAERTTASDGQTDLTIRVNGTVRASNTFTPAGGLDYTIDTFKIGDDGAADSQFYLGELLLYPRALSCSERHAIELYLAKKWHLSTTPATICASGQLPLF